LVALTGIEPVFED